MSLAALVVLLPLAAAALLGLIPSMRLAAWANFAMAALTFAAALALAWIAPAPSGAWLTDGLALHMAVLTAFIGMTSAGYSVAYIGAELAAGRMERSGARTYHVMFQALLGFMLLALLADNPAITWVAMEAATIAAAIVVALPATAAAIEAAWKYFILCGVGVALALFGTVVLYLAGQGALGPGPAGLSWTALTAAAPRCSAAVLNLAFVFLLIGYGTKAALAPLHAWMPDAHAEGPTPVSAILAASIMNVALVAILRLRGIMEANNLAHGGALPPGPPLMALGLLSLLLAAFSLWRRRDVKRFFAFSTIEQSGVAAYAFGLGGAGATYAGLLHLTLHTIAKAAVYFPVGQAAQMKGGQSFDRISGLLGSHRGLGLALACAILAVAGLPPFGLFSSEFLVLTETLLRQPLLALPLGIGLLTGAWALIARLQTLCLGRPTPDRFPRPHPAALVPAFLHLVVVLVLGLAMPQGVANWFADIAGAITPGTVNPAASGPAAVSP